MPGPGILGVQPGWRVLNTAQVILKSSQVVLKFHIFSELPGNLKNKNFRPTVKVSDSLGLGWPGNLQDSELDQVPGRC